MDEKLKFSSGKFTVLQVSDAQDLQYVRSAMTQMLKKAYDTVKPDLILFTGDNILGNHLLDKRFGNKKNAFGFAAEYDRMKTALYHILKPVEKRRIPFAVIFGNHDDRNSVTKEEQAEIFRSYSGFRGLDNTDDSVRFGSYRLPVYSGDGSKEVLDFYMLDSAYYDKDEDKCYQNVSENTVKWLGREIAGHPDTVSLIFQHIPFPEIEELIEECSEKDPGAVLIKDGGNQRFFRLRPDRASGILGEGVGHTEENFGEFDVINNAETVAGVVFGHDHLNNFEGKIGNVRVIQTPGASFRSYGNRQRGVRVFVFNENEPARFRTYTLSYADLCGNLFAQKLRYIWDADDYEDMKYCVLLSSAISAAAVSLGAAAIISSKNKKK